MSKKERDDRRVPYIYVSQLEVPNCKRGEDCDPHEDPEHHVSVQIGEPILDPYEKMLSHLSEIHDENMALEGGMTKHRREEPRCEYCSTIRQAQKVLRAIKGKDL